MQKFSEEQIAYTLGTTRSAHSIELAADSFNLPNLLPKQWGLMRESASAETLPLLAVSGWDAAANRSRH